MILNASSARNGGALTHLQTLLEAASGLDGYEFVLVAPHNIVANVDVPAGFEVHGHDHKAGSLRLRTHFDQVVLRKLSHDSDAFISLVNSGPIRLSSNVPHTLLLRNELLLLPTTRTFGALGLLSRLAASNAQRLVVPSKHMKELVNTKWGLDAEVIPHPLPKDYLDVADRRIADIATIFVPTSQQPHKNLGLIGRTSEILHSRGLKHEFRLTLDQAPAEVNSPSICAIGRLSTPAMVTEYLSASCVFLPSQYESFSYPMAEAGRVGVPIAASNIVAHQEWDHLSASFDPTSPNEAAAAIETALRLGPPDRLKYSDFSGSSYLKKLLE